jgi:catechol 2,3-dioxygenase-like lactoylglutathione lyase family enzyme
MSITHLQIVSVPVSDQDRARVFYVDTLGFELRADNPMGPGQRWVQVAPPGTDQLDAGHLVRDHAGRLAQGLVLECDDIQAAYKELSERGVSFQGAIRRESWEPIPLSTILMGTAGY